MVKLEKVWVSALIVDKVSKKCAKSRESIRKCSRSWESTLKFEKVFTNAL